MTPGNKYLYAKLANKHCLNDRGSRILGFRLGPRSLAALMSCRRTERSLGSSGDRERRRRGQRGRKEGRRDSRGRGGGEKEPGTKGTRTDLLRYLAVREEC